MTLLKISCTFVKLCEGIISINQGVKCSAEAIREKSTRGFMGSAYTNTGLCGCAQEKPKLYCRKNSGRSAARHRTVFSFVPSCWTQGASGSLRRPECSSAIFDKWKTKIFVVLSELAVFCMSRWIVLAYMSNSNNILLIVSPA